MDLRFYMFKNKLKNQEFCKVIGCDRSILSQIVNGKYVPSKKLAIRIEEATNGNVKAIFYEKLRRKKFIKKLREILKKDSLSPAKLVDGEEKDVDLNLDIG